MYNRHRYKPQDYFTLQAAHWDLVRIQRKMIMFWFYSGYVGDKLVEGTYGTKEEALEAFKDWPSGAPKLKQ